MKYKLLVLDVDGTLLNDEREISKRTLAALLKVQQMGVRIVLASGRPTYGLMPLAKVLELGNYGGFVLSYNGCQIIKAQNGEILFERRINPEMLPYLEKKARKNGFAIFTYHDDNIITDSPNNEHIKREAQLNNLRIIREEEFSTAIDFAPCKCMLVSNKEEALVGLEQHWKRRLAGTLDTFRSEPYFLEVVPCGVDKANTLGVLLEHLGVKREEVIAIGRWRMRCDHAPIGRHGGSYGTFTRLGKSLCRLCDHIECRRWSGSGRRKTNIGRSTCGRDSPRLAERTGTPRIDGKLRHPIYVRFGRTCRSNHAGRPPYPPTFRHLARRCNPRFGRNRRRTRLHDNLRTRRNCRGNASQWKPHFLCTRGRYCKGSRYYPAQRTFIPYLECGCIYFDKQIGFLHTGGE